MSSATRREINWLNSCENLAKTFSTCAKRQYFSVILMSNGRVAGVGYNGSPPGLGHCVDGACPRLAQGSEPGSIYDNCIAQHAEANALLWSDPSQRIGSTLIVNGPPCFGCAKQIASSGVQRVVFFADKTYKDWAVAYDLLQRAGIETIEVERETQN
jgi:dCMP deaminase